VKFKVAVIGTINRDTIHLYQGGLIQGFGGILYNLFALSYLFGSDATIYPVCNVGHDVYEEVLKKLRKRKNLRLDAVRKVERRNNHATLFYPRKGEKSEILKGRVPPLSFERMKNVLDSDFILVNFISGVDLTLATLKKVFSNRKGKLFVDLHSLTLGIDRDGKRFFRRPSDWEEYVRNCDYLQLNRKELEVITRSEDLKVRELYSRMQDLNRLGPQGVIVTLGRRGTLACLREGDKIRKQRFCSSPSLQKVDTTGCGDVFSAGFIYRYLTNGDFFRAVEFANRVAGFKVGFSGVEGLRDLNRPSWLFYRQMPSLDAELFFLI
jgi:sugar/nucleoside kinase (ribokinase family)